MSERSGGSGGISATTALALIFITLKLIGVEPVSSWSWLWILSPIWIGVLAAVAIVIVFYSARSILESIRTRKNMKEFMDI